MSEVQYGPWEIEYGHADNSEDGVIYVTSARDFVVWVGDAYKARDVAMAHFIAAAPLVYEALLDVEWTTARCDVDARCPMCGNTRAQGHWEQCELAEALAAARNPGRVKRGPTVTPAPHTAYPPATEEPEPEPREPAHSVSTETLRHYRCAACAQWWSVADHPDPTHRRAHCPHCGKIANVEGLE